MGFKLLLIFLPITAFGVDCPPPSAALPFPSQECNKATGTPEMVCSSPAYNKGDAKAKCETCRATINSWKSKFPDIMSKFQSTDQDLAAKTAKATKKVAKGTSGDALSAFNAASDTTSDGKDGMSKRAANANDTKKQFQQCLDDIAKNCATSLYQQGKAGSDYEVAATVKKACEDASKKAGDFADEKSKDGMNMGDLSKLMQAASQAMQAMQQQQQPDQPQQQNSDVSQATAPTPTQVAKTEVSKFDDGKSGTIPPGVGFGGPTTTAPLLNTGVAQGGSVTGLDSKGDRHLASTGDLGSGASASLASAGGGGPPAGGGSSSSSGASSPGGGAAAPTESGASPSEMQLGGGLKFGGGGGGGKKDGGLDPLGGDTASALGDTHPEDLAKSGEGTGENAAATEDPLAGEGDSIFLRVRQKYALLKGAGRI